MATTGLFNLVAATAALREMYDGQKIHNLVYADRPTVALMRKKKDFFGKYKPIPIQTGVSQGRSTVFSNAQANQSAPVLESFFLTRTRDYSIGTIDTETMLASSNDKGSFLNGLKFVGDSCFRSASNSMSSAIFRSGTGSIGQISSITSGVIQLTNVGDIVGFENNMTLQANATDGGTPRAALGYVVGRNARTGVVTVSASAIGGSAGSPTGWSVGDFLLVQGDLNGKPAGFSAWLPSVAPTTGSNFFQVDRSTDTRLYGLFYSGLNQPLEETVIDASSILAREGGKANVMITNYLTFSAFEKALGSKVQYTDLMVGEIGFRGIMINGANSQIRVFPDAFCQAQTGWLLTMDTWAIESLGEAPQLIPYPDNNSLLRVTDQDSAEMRVASFYNVSSYAPGWNSQILFPV